MFVENLPEDQSTDNIHRIFCQAGKYVPSLYLLTPLHEVTSLLGDSVLQDGLKQIFELSSIKNISIRDPHAVEESAKGNKSKQLLGGKV